MDEQEFDEILTYLSKSKYPENIKSKDSRSNWRKKCRPFTYCKDQLYYNHKKYGALEAVRGVKDKRKIIESSHLQPDGRHHGINRTLKKISTNYYWKTIAKDVHYYVKIECQTCTEQGNQQNNSLRHASTAQAESDGGLYLKSTEKIVDKAIEQIGLDVIGNILEPSVPSPQEPVCSVFKCETAVPQQTMQQPLVLRDHIMAHCGLDVIGPLSETHKGKRYIVILTDCVTKWVEALAVSEFTTDTVGNFLAETICRHGSIEEIMTKHNHDEFCARLTEKMCSTMGITIRISALLPSQSNGYPEHYCYNSLLCGALIKYSNQNQYYWDIYLHHVILAYRTFHQKNTPGSPFKLLYDRPTRLPVLDTPQSASDNYSDEQDALIDHMINYIKVLSCPTHQQPLGIHNQHSDRLTPPYLTPNNISTPIPSSTSNATAHQPHQSTQALSSFTHAVQVNNQINTNLPLTTLGTCLQPSHSNATVHTIQSNSMTAQAISANTMATHTISGNSVSTHNIQGNLTAHTISANSGASHSIPSNSHIISTPAVTQVASHVITPHVTVAQSTAVQTPTNMTTQTTSDAHSGHMVMIHTDGKAYTESFYVICPQ
ncbi:hypothetical protein OTU49_009357 [Cherax quadricarinatus]|uniref:RNA-directed DNA polymerase n=1 Tax=Cherax quadricarinatus TaxID=27406 RepID=A0AAW0WAD5_CHEQU